MKILFVYRNNRQDPCLQALHRWLPRQHDVTTFEFTLSERGRFECTVGAPRFRELLDRVRPEMVFDWVGYLNADEVRWSKERGAVTVRALNGFTSFHVGHIRSQPAFFDLLRALDYYFVPHAPHVPILRELGVNAFEMPYFYDPVAYHPLPLWLRMFDLYQWDVFFAGGVAVPWGWNRKQVVEAIGRRSRVCLLSDIDPKLPGVKCYGAVTFPPAVNWMMNRSKIVLGSDFLPSVESYHKAQTDIVLPYVLDHTIRSRTFTAMGSGACYMVERHPEVERFFEDGSEIVLWSSAEEAADRAAYLQQHDDERRAIAKRGQEKVRRLHTAETRLREMFDIVTRKERVA